MGKKRQKIDMKRLAQIADAESGETGVKVEREREVAVDRYEGEKDLLVEEKDPQSEKRAGRSPRKRYLATGLKDSMQDTMVKLIEKGWKLDADGKPISSEGRKLFPKILQDKVVDKRRKEMKEVRLTGKPETKKDYVKGTQIAENFTPRRHSMEDIAEFRHALSKCPSALAGSWDALEDVFRFGKTHEQMAEELGIAKSTATEMIRRVRLELMPQLPCGEPKKTTAGKIQSQYPYGQLTDKQAQDLADYQGSIESKLADWRLSLSKDAEEVGEYEASIENKLAAWRLSNRQKLRFLSQLDKKGRTKLFHAIRYFETVLKGRDPRPKEVEILGARDTE